ncbi:MAG: hypothetical protein ACYTGF_16835 [Planctomycetota bacterium]|jgi:hypothetical protein
MLFIVRRILFAAGAVLLAGGWGLTGFVDQHQHAAGDEAFVWWVEGVDLSEDSPNFPMMVTRSTRTGDSPSLEQVFQMLESDGSGSAAEVSTPVQAQADVDRAVLPSMWLYLAAVTAMAAGAGCMGLAAPWRGCDDGVEYESSANMPLRLQRGP